MKTYIELIKSWFTIGLFTFGGGYAMLPLIEKEIVDKHKWATKEEILDYFAISQCTPGVIAVNSATFIGYKIKGVFGAILSTLSVVTPSLIIISLIAGFISNFSELDIVNHALNGIRIAVCVLMASSIYKLIKTSIKSKIQLLMFILAFILAYFIHIPTAILVFSIIVFGIILGRVINYE